VLEDEGLGRIISRRLGLDHLPGPDLTEWREIVNRLRYPQGGARIALVGKYMGVEDSYVSIVEALRHGGIAHGRGRDQGRFRGARAIGRLSSSRTCPGITGSWSVLDGARGGRGGCGDLPARSGRAVSGICYGDAVAVVEFARHVCG
jgi:CTP synthase